MTDPPEPPGPHLEGTASGHSRLQQAGRDIHQQHIDRQTVLGEGAVRPAAEVPAPPGLMNVPGHQHIFVGRHDELGELDAALEASGGVVVAAVHGLGGVGKSTLAARYAAHHAERTDGFGPVWWITAENPEGVQAGLAALATALQPVLTRVLPLEELAGWALDWLSCHEGWLLVLDNVEDPADIASVMDRAARGRVLITSRLGEGWHRFGAEVVRLEVLTPAQAVELLTRIARPCRDGADLDGAEDLAAELGYLPLAVEQAAAFLHQNRLSPRAYLDLLADSPVQMFDLPATGGDAARTIARIWRTTLDQLTATPLAGRLLRILAWYAPDTIPRSLPEGLHIAAPSAGRRARPSGWTRRRHRHAPASNPVEPAQLQQALGSLAAYNMITLHDDGAISVHRLVQALARTPDPADPHRQRVDVDDARDTATHLLNRARPANAYDPASWPNWRRLLPLVDALAAHAPPGTDTDTTAELLTHTADFLEDQGALARAIIYRQRAIASTQRLHGDHHPDTLTCRNHLAGTYQEAGDLAQAISLYEQTLAASERVRGTDHPDTLISRTSLAGAFLHTGDLDRAIPLIEQSLAASERALGTDHPVTLASRSWLATAYRSAGDIGQAIRLFEQTLAFNERDLSSDHPATLAIQHNLAVAYRDAGDLEQAIVLFERTVIDRERVQGADHPLTLRSRNSLAIAYRLAGDLGKAILLHEQTLAASERVLDPDHPAILRSRNDLAVAYKAAGDLERAIPLFERTLAESEQAQGPDHPLTKAVRENLEEARQEQDERP
ncbi:tetratricopeptide repeat protein [Actinomadura sp. 3N508]|uniref:tetratricopeptide repeat protein n=1 Tax=Actinomadura sp. 3N508 TaxID=3375153 RepID=UPI00378FA27E